MNVNCYKKFILTTSTKGSVMTRHYKPLSSLLAAALGIAFATSVMANEVATGTSRSSDADYRQALQSAKADYDAAYSACTGPERLECRREARNSWEMAQEDARVGHGLDWPKPNW
jgi:hypothetical protein